MSKRDDLPPTPVEDGGDSWHTRIVIKPGGEVLIENLSMDLLELAELLDPNSPVACQRPDPDADDDEDDKKDPEEPQP